MSYVFMCLFACCSNPNKEPIVTEAVSFCNICSVLHLFVNLSFVRLSFELVSSSRAGIGIFAFVEGDREGNQRRARVNSSVFHRWNIRAQN